MPETIRAEGGSLKARLRDHPLRTPPVAGALPRRPPPAAAQEAGGPCPFTPPSPAPSARLEQHEVAALALILGVILFAVVTSVLLVRTRARAIGDRAAAREKIAGL